MIKAKKTLSLILAIVLAFGVFAINAFAATDSAKLTVTSSKTTGVLANENIVLTVKLENNYFLASAAVPVKFDSAKFTYVSCAVATDIFTAAGATNGVVKDTDAVNGNLLVTISPNAQIAGAAAKKFTTAGTLFTITLKAKENITAPTTVSVDMSEHRTTAKPYGKLYVASISGADVKDDKLVITAVDVPLTAVNATIGESAVLPPVIQAKAAKTGVVDATRKYVYGITPGEAVVDYFEATNGGTLTISGNGTGATVQLKDSTGKLVDTYTVIIFGDVDGNGAIDGVDVTKIGQYFGGTSSALTGLALLAADVDANGVVDAVDTTRTGQYFGGTNSALDQTIGFKVV